MYDYLAKIILLGPSGSGKSCLLHRFVKSEWRSLTSQTIGVEFASKIIRVGTGTRRQRVKLQLWDTAGTERFRSVSRSYYRGAAGAILVYDVASKPSFDQLGTFLRDARALASPNLTVVLAGNKVDVVDGGHHHQNIRDDSGDLVSGEFATSYASTMMTNSDSMVLPSSPSPNIRSRSNISTSVGTRQTVTQAPDGRTVIPSMASTWASSSSIPVAVEVSAYNGEGVDDLFHRLARMILTKIELGEIDPDDPASGIQYGDASGWGMVDDGAGSIKSGKGGWGMWRRRGGGRNRPGTSNGLREWEEVFRIDRRRGGCC